MTLFNNYCRKSQITRKNQSLIRVPTFYLILHVYRVVFVHICNWDVWTAELIIFKLRRQEHRSPSCCSFLSHMQGMKRICQSKGCCVGETSCAGASSFFNCCRRGIGYCHRLMFKSKYVLERAKWIYAPSNFVWGDFPCLAFIFVYLRCKYVTGLSI